MRTRHQHRPWPAVGLCALFAAATMAALPTRAEAQLVSGLEGASGSTIVPTGLEVHGNTVCMAETGPTPHEPEDGRVIAISAKSGAVAEVGRGARMLVDVEAGRGRALYALAQGTWDGVAPGSPARPMTGSLVEVDADGTFTVIADSLNLPTSLEIIDNTAYVVSLTGEIWVIPNLSDPPFGQSR